MCMSHSGWPASKPRRNPASPNLDTVRMMSRLGYSCRRDIQVSSAKGA